MKDLIFKLNLSYFAKPFLIPYDEWFVDDLEEKIVNHNKKKRKNFSSIHEFFYRQSNYKIGASENNFQMDIEVQTKKLLSTNKSHNFSKNNFESSIEGRLIRNSSKQKINSSPTGKFFYRLTVGVFLLIFGSMILLIFQSENKEINTNIQLSKLD